MRPLTLFPVGLLATGCATTHLTPREAADLTDNLTVLASHPPDPDTLARISMDLCGEIPSCAGSCQHALHAAAELTDASMHGAILSECFSELKSEHSATGISADAWMTHYFAAYLDRVTGSLSPEQQKALGDARGRLQLYSPGR